MPFDHTLKSNGMYGTGLEQNTLSQENRLAPESVRLHKVVTGERCRSHSCPTDMPIKLLVMERLSALFVNAFRILNNVVELSMSAFSPIILRSSLLRGAIPQLPL